MEDKYKTEGQRLDELVKLRQRITDFLKSETGQKRAEQAPKLGRYQVKKRR